MARKEKNIHYIYKTTCNVTGKYYVGMHSTNNLEDGYLGSGKRLRYSIRKYGKDNHIKEIVEYCETREALVLRETEIVNKELIADDKCMNLKEGGTGGFSNEEHFNNFKKGRIWGLIIGNKKASDLRRGSTLEKGHVDKVIASRLKYFETNDGTFKNKKHSDETKQLISEKRKGTGTGETNSQYGTCWITKDGINKKIKKEDLETYLNEDWVKGRK
jgi:hypothetical protein